MTNDDTKNILFTVPQDQYDRFWRMKNQLHPEMGEAITHEEAFAYLLYLHDEYGTVEG